jgi:hypothetical protein
VDEKKVGSKKAKVENVDRAARTKQLRYGNQKKWFGRKLRVDSLGLRAESKRGKQIDLLRSDRSAVALSRRK